MSDPWSQLAGRFVDDAYPTVKGYVRTYVLHHQMLAHLPPAPATVIDVGGGAGHQSIPLARLGYAVTIVDPSAAMFSRAEQRLSGESSAVRARVSLIEAAGVDAPTAAGGDRFDAVLCHGVLMYLPQPHGVVNALCRLTALGGIVSTMALNANTMAVRPALDARWADALAAFDATAELGVLGAPTRADTVEDLSRLLRRGGIIPEQWYGVWLFSDWMDLPVDGTAAQAVALVELEAARRDPYRQLSRVFHLVGRAV